MNEKIGTQEFLTVSDNGVITPCVPVPDRDNRI